jgi:hypothetical protein
MYIKIILFLMDICLHFKCYPLSWFPLCKPPSLSPLTLLLWESSPTHPLLPHCSSIPLHWGIKPSQDQGPPLPLMPDKASLAPSVLPLTPPLGFLCSVRWLAASIWIRIGQDLTEHLRRVSGSCQHIYFYYVYLCECMMCMCKRVHDTMCVHGGV